MTYFACQGSDSDFLYFNTPSRSRAKLFHNVVVCKRSGHVSCDCEACQYKVRTGGDVLDPSPPGACFHVYAFCSTVGKIIARALGVPQTVGGQSS